MVRVDPSKDETNGFFVALFERVRAGKGNPVPGGDTADASAIPCGDGGCKKRKKRSKSRKKKKKKKNTTATEDGESEMNEGEGMQAVAPGAEDVTVGADSCTPSEAVRQRVGLQEETET